jgi:hypothetical protein
MCTIAADFPPYFGHSVVGTMNGWKNESSLFLTVIIPLNTVKVEATGETLQPTTIPGLTD